MKQPNRQAGGIPAGALVIVGVLAFGILAPQTGKGEDPKAAPAPTQSSEDKDSVVPIILLMNETTLGVKYRIPDKNNPEGGETFLLEPDRIHLYKQRELTIGYGFGYRPAQLLAGRLYVMRRDTKGELILHALALSKEEAVQTELNSVRTDLDRSKQDAASLNKSIAQMQAKISHLEKQVAEVSVQREAVVSQMSKQSLRFEGVPLELGSARVDVKIALNDVLEPGMTVRAEANLNRPRCSLKVVPDRFEIADQEKLELQLQLDNVSSAEPCQGEILVHARGPKLNLRLTIPYTVEFDRKQDQVDDADVLNVLTWPPGARVFLTDLSKEIREDLGTTPVAVRIPAGLYRVELAAPPGAEGEWAGPTGHSPSVPGENLQSNLFVSYLRKEKTKALVRAIWLEGEGTIVERLTKAIQGSQSRFTPPEYETFFEQYATALAKIGARADQDEARKLYAVLGTTGYVRWFLNEQVAMDFLLPRDGSPSMTAKVVRLGPAESEIDLEPRTIRLEPTTNRN